MWTKQRMCVLKNTLSLLGYPSRVKRPFSGPLIYFRLLDDVSFKTHVFIWREGIWRNGKEREVRFYNQIKSDR
jgi:hypothetical protein